jgi:hypothetical protein
MKKKSVNNCEITYKLWETPLDKVFYHHLSVVGVLQTTYQVYFFLSAVEEYDKKTHVVSIPRNYPYRIMEEEYAYAGIFRHFRGKDITRKSGEVKNKYCSTWKFWHTDMIKELDHGSALSDYGKIKSKEIIHYMIRTGGDVIEFISPATRWKIHKNIKIEKLIESYVKEKFSEKFFKK